MDLVYYSKFPMRIKYAANLAMGDARLSTLQSATGNDGRLHPLTTGDPRDQAGSAFSEMQRQMRIDSNDETNEFSVGSDQSKTARAQRLARRTTFRDLDISVETDTGSHRQWHDPHTGREGKTLMQYPYGYIRGTQGMDGEHIDCFVGPDEDAESVYIITTNKGPDFKDADEQKVMLGFASAAQAKQAFLAHYSDPKFFRALSTLPYAAFRNRAFKTLHSRTKKIGSTANFDGIYDWNRNAQGPHHDQVPGDYLGFPASSLVGLRQIEGNPMSPSDRVDRMFRFNDQEMNTRVLDGNDAAAPADPGV